MNALSFRRNPRFVLWPLLLAASVFVRAQGTSERVAGALQAYDREGLREKLFVHTDKTVYLPGELCWFRIYYVDATWQQPAAVSRIAYVDLIDDNGISRVQEKVSLKPGEAGGSFVIPLGLATGGYTLRAYTRWMKNFGDEWFFHTRLDVINPAQPDSAAGDSDPLPGRFDIQFFPEGGNLVQGLSSRVGFRVTDAYGRGQSFTGRLIGPRGDSLLNFSPVRLGLGSFEFTPADTGRYRYSIVLAGGAKREGDLPAACPAGYVLHAAADEAKKQLLVTVSSTGTTDASLMLAVHTRGLLKYLNTAPAAGGKVFFAIPADSLGEGISTITLFTAGGKPVCERLYFTYPKAELAVGAASAPEYGLREKVDIVIDVSGPDGKPSPADLSLAVFHAGTFQVVPAGDIRSYLYLTSDLGQPVETPGIYFTDSLAVRSRAIDNLMLTQGWRRFSWEEVFHGARPAPVFGPEYNGHLIDARLLDATSVPVRAGRQAFCSVPGPFSRFRATETDSAGRLHFEMPWFYQSEEIVLQAAPEPGSAVHFEVNSPFAPGRPTAGRYHPVQTGPGQEALTDEHVRNQVERFYHAGQLRRFEAPALDTGFFYGVPDEMYRLDDFTRFTTMEEVLREYVVSINVYRKKGGLHIQVWNPERREYYQRAPLILVDGVPLLDDSKLFRYDPLKLRRLDLLTKMYFVGYQRFDGVINCVTYQGNLDGFEMDPAANVLDYPGISAQREFFSPEYHTEQQVASRLPDFRSLLYWSPQVKPGTDGKAVVSFYTSDLPGDYSVVVQGLSPEGKTAFKTISFAVRKK